MNLHDSDSSRTEEPASRCPLSASRSDFCYMSRHPRHMLQGSRLLTGTQFIWRQFRPAPVGPDLNARVIEGKPTFRASSCPTPWNPGFSPVVEMYATRIVELPPVGRRGDRLSRRPGIGNHGGCPDGTVASCPPDDQHLQCHCPCGFRHGDGRATLGLLQTPTFL